MAASIHLTPYLPPQNSGVGDYAMLIGRRMEELGGVRCGYVAAGHTAGSEPANGANVRNIAGACSGRVLWQAVDELRAAGGSICAESNDGRLAIVLHYSGYGYDRNGCPQWLVDALRNRPAWVGRVVTYFHELYATGRPWQRAFWYSARQRRIAAEVARFSDAILTNREQSARWLEQATGRATGSVPSLPVPSNVGEPEQPLRLEERGAIAVCFGAARFKQTYFRRDAAKVSAICAATGVRQICDLGEPTNIDSSVFERHGIHVVSIGYAAAEVVSAHLQTAKIAFADYFPAYLAKSGVFAAVAAHGVPLIMSDACVIATDGLKAGQQYLCLRAAQEATQNSEPLLGMLSDCSRQLFQWYQGHSAEVHAMQLLNRVAEHGRQPASVAAN